jgi:hypothetical protein
MQALLVAIAGIKPLEESNFQGLLKAVLHKCGLFRVLILFNFGH